MTHHTCYEFEVLRCTGALREALERHHGEHGIPYYRLVRGGVQFQQYVGVLQIGSHTIEVLPKIDRASRGKGKEEERWRNILIDMLRRTDSITLHISENSALRIKPNSILEHYMERFLQEVEYLMHRGLSKHYHNTEGNRNSLRGKLLFDQHLRLNAVHAERFFVQHSTYDQVHVFNQLLRQTLQLIQSIASGPHWAGRLQRILRDFPDMPELHVSERLFQRLPWSRKTEAYRNAIDIARMLLLQYHPDLRGGDEHVLALMFDMNKLWERYVIQVLRRSAQEGWRVESQHSQVFWEAHTLKEAFLKPDIVLLGPQGQSLVLDTKWKLLDGRPGDHDLRQLFAYLHQWNAHQGYLIYPDAELLTHIGRYHVGDRHCHVLRVQVLDQEGRLDPNLGTKLWTQLNIPAPATPDQSSPQRSTMTGLHDHRLGDWKSL